jgi:hypothetical protein
MNLPPAQRTIELLLVLEVTPAELLAAGEEMAVLSADPEGPGHFERSMTMSDETTGVEQGPGVVEEPGLKSERLQDAVPSPLDPLGVGEDPDLKSERLQDE